jgi:hypothetical protein
MSIFVSIDHPAAHLPGSAVILAACGLEESVPENSRSNDHAAR